MVTAELLCWLRQLVSHQDDTVSRSFSVAGIQGGIVGFESDRPDDPAHLQRDV
jgi:hypothetical protein